MCRIWPQALCRAFSGWTVSIHIHLEGVQDFYIQVSCRRITNMPRQRSFFANRLHRTHLGPKCSLENQDPALDDYFQRLSDNVALQRAPPGCWIHYSVSADFWEFFVFVR